MFLETFCILCLVFTVGYFIITPAKEAWNKLPSAPYREECEVRLNKDTLNYDLWFRGKTYKDNQRASVKSSFENHVASLRKVNGCFVADIRREKVPLVGPLLKKETVTASNLQELAAKIEKIFDAWDSGNP